MDKELKTHPVLGDQSWHFNTYNDPKTFRSNSLTDTYVDSRRHHAVEQMEIAVVAYKDGRIEDAMKALGKGLHALQDIDAHGDKFVGITAGKWSHIKFPFDSVPAIGKEADNTKYERERYDRTVQQTMDYLEEFKSKTGYKPDE